MRDYICRAGITGLSTSIPEKVLTNYDLEKMVETSDDWINARTGIKERRIVENDKTTCDLACEAGQNALENAGIGPEELDLVIVATNTPDMIFPATACLVQDRIGAVNAGAFDLLAGCTGFIYGLTVGQQYVAAGAYDKVLVIGAETLSKIINWKDRNTCVLFGDGAGAAVVQQVPREYGIISSVLGSDGSGGKLLKLPAGGSKLPASEETVRQGLHYVDMSGREVFKFAVRAMGEGTRKALSKAGMGSEDLDLLIPHQANIRIIDTAAKKAGIDMDRVLVNVDRFGNTSTASVPIALCEAVEQGKIKRGDNIVMVGFGAGLTWASLLMTWY
ncbi:MAG: ketoacyl-ACP synthase III [Clostridiales bacterium]|nr:ketoacyl-ACP synthase III [Clostridiales bacterium]MCF8022590.1 ketoacyl-ACP synthase III [Clostridiales bacterium]